MKRISNDTISIAVKEHGAELVSIRKGEREYMWQAAPEFWGRTSPVLFPMVGSVWNGKFRTKGKEFGMGQHGFARDMDFKLTRATDTELEYVLESSEETLLKFPFHFRLTISYRIHGNSIDVMWNVRNTGTDELSFQIGAHPAFYWPLLSTQTINDNLDAVKAELAIDDKRGFFHFDSKAEALISSAIVEKGCFSPTDKKKISLEDGYLPLTTGLFNRDALVLEDGQVHEVTLCDQDKTPYLTLKFDAPLVGLWSPPGKNAPFVCIEPWYGRADSVEYNGNYEDRKWTQHLQSGQEFKAKYEITIAM